jgi:adenine-specific DNA glycosylase
LMDLVARICTARAPACSLCPWQGDCRSAQDPSAQQARATPLTARPGRLASAGAGPDDQPAPPRRGRVGVRPRRLVVALVTSRERYLLVPAGLGWGLPSFTPSAAGRERQELEGMLRRDLQLDLLAARAFLTAMVVVDGETLRLQVYRCRLFADDPAADTTPQAAWRWVTASDLVATPLPAPAGPIMDRLRTYHGLSGHRPPVGRVADG